MKILIASDSFKGSLSSSRIGQIIQEELQADHQIDFIPFTDGGEGFLESWQTFFEGAMIKQQVPDPLLRDIECPFLLVDHDTALIESARTCGLNLLSKEEQNPLHTSTYGLGKMILAAIRKGVKKIYIGLGGSATNDGGMGLLQAMGAIFYDHAGLKIHTPGGIALSRIHTINPSKVYDVIRDVSIYGICDVNNPLLGPHGATLVYGLQKGGNPESIKLLEAGMSNFSKVTKKTIQKDYATMPGAGAAGGLGFCLQAYLKAELLPGIEATIKLSRLETKAEAFDLLLTGEGTLDEQSVAGKVPWGVLEMGIAANKPVICICGQNKLRRTTRFEKIFSIVPELTTLPKSLSNPEYYLRSLVSERIVKWLKAR